MAQSDRPKSKKFNEFEGEELRLQPLDTDLESKEPVAIEDPFQDLTTEDLVPSVPVQAAAAPDSDQTHTFEATTDEDQSEDREEQLQSAERRKLLLNAVPSWLISLLVHLGLILILAAISLDPISKVISLLEASTSSEEAALETFDLQSPTLEESTEANDPLPVTSPEMSEIVMPEIAAAELTPLDMSLADLSSNRITDSIMPSELFSSSNLAQMTAALDSRSSASKSEMLERFGGTAASEKAVAMALKWISMHQAPDGGWSFAHSAICNGQCQNPGSMDLARNGATAMALLPFLGAGQTHLEGQYKTHVYKGLAFLISRLKVKSSYQLPVGDWHEPGGRMYSHSLAAIAICEAYAMTQDPDLLQPAQLSLNYLIAAQHQAGGWRYKPGDRGDTSVVGWCLMALKSGKMGGLVVPQASFTATDKFLQFVSTNNGAYYGYTDPSPMKRSGTTSVGLLCKMYLGYPREHPGLKEGVAFLSERGPSLSDLYYTYYATQVMRHHGGNEWERWNTQLRDALIGAQEKSGHAAGSWHVNGPHMDNGGRLCATSFATMILEVYYRHMPLYSDRSLTDDFEL